MREEGIWREKTELDFEYDNRQLGLESQNGKLKVH